MQIRSMKRKILWVYDAYLWDFLGLIWRSLKINSFEYLKKLYHLFLLQFFSLLRASLWVEWDKFYLIWLGLQRVPTTINLNHKIEFTRLLSLAFFFMHKGLCLLFLRTIRTFKSRIKCLRQWHNCSIFAAIF